MTYRVSPYAPCTPWFKSVFRIIIAPGKRPRQRTKRHEYGFLDCRRRHRWRIGWLLAVAAWNGDAAGARKSTRLPLDRALRGDVYRKLWNVADQGADLRQPRFSRSS